MVAQANGLAHEIWVGLAVNLASTVLFALIPAVLLAVAIRRYWLRDRYSFFGIHGRGDRVEIRLSNIYVNPGGTTGVMQLKVGFTGPAISEGEYQSGLALAATIEGGPIFGFGRFLADVLRTEVTAPRGLCRLAVSPHTAPLPRPSFDEFGDPEHPIELTPQSAGLTEPELSGAATWIFVGGPVYNSLTDYMFRELSSEHAFFTLYRKPLRNGDIERGFVLRRPGTKDPVYFYPKAYTRTQVEGRRGVDPASGTIYREFFVLQRVCGWRHPDLRSPRTIFICAGTSMSATVAAVRTLSDWRNLHRDFRGQSFAALYEVETNDREWVAYPNSSRVMHVSRVWSSRD